MVPFRNGLLQLEPQRLRIGHVSLVSGEVRSFLEIELKPKYFFLKRAEREKSMTLGRASHGCLLKQLDPA